MNQRKLQKQQTPSFLTEERFADITIDHNHFRLIGKNTFVDLSVEKEYKLLCLLKEFYPAYAQKHIIMDAIWPEVVVSDTSLRELKFELNQKFKLVSNKIYIENIRSFGYGLEIKPSGSKRKNGKTN